MVHKFVKTKECGCIIESIFCGTKQTIKGKMYLIGGHKHLTMCNKCKEDEENGEDTLFDMWLSDNVTNDDKYGGWELKNNSIQTNNSKTIVKIVK